jgi:hypothetical protein
MKEVFEQADLEVTKENRKDIDRAIHDIVGVEYKNCSATWKAVKEKLAENMDDFIQELKTTCARA